MKLIPEKPEGEKNVVESNVFRPQVAQSPPKRAAFSSNL